jgi:hypothetical protein
VTWPSKNQDGAGWDIAAQVFDSAGLKVNAEFVLNTTTAGDQSQPAVAAFGEGNFVAAWTSDRAGGPAADIFTQRLRVPME